MSDIHLEFGWMTEEELRWRGDVLIIAGDFLEVAQIRTFYDHLDDVFKMAPKIYWVFGNHEHYGGDLKSSHRRAREFIERRWDHVEILENDLVHLNSEWSLFGATFWTDFNRRNPNYEFLCMRRMNDFRAIKEAGNGIFPEVLVSYHEATKRALRTSLESLDPSRKLLVVSHHAPCELSVGDRFVHEVALNSAYFSDQSEFITNRQVQMWIHGHIHQTQDYTVDGCRVLANPRGYADYEPCAKNFTVLDFEI